MNTIDKKNIFIISCGDNKNIIYLPLRNTSFFINDEGASAISKYLKGNDFLPSEIEIKKTFENIYASTQIQKTPPLPNILKSNSISIILHQKCNLDCSYCFAHDDRGNESLTLENVKQIINSWIDNEGSKSVTFIGGGEPTFNWPLLHDAILYIRQFPPKNITIKVVTNGTLLDDSKIQFLEKNNVVITISFDILPEIQDSQRKFYNTSKSSYLAVDTLIRKLKNYQLNFAIRATITEKNVARMPEMVQHIFDNYPHVKKVHLEHITDDKLSDSYYEDFFKFFFEARNLGKVLDIDVYNSITIAQRNIKSYGFCSGAKCFIPQPNGDIIYNFCHRFSVPPSQFINNLRISNFSPTGIHIPNPLFSQLSIPKECEACYARWHCAGGCMAERITLTPKLLERKCQMFRLFCLRLLQEEMKG